MTVKLPSRFGSAISMKPPRGQTCSACFSMRWLPPAPGGSAQLLVAVLEQLLASASTSSSLTSARRTTEPAPSAAITRCSGHSSQSAGGLVAQHEAAMPNVRADGGRAKANVDAGALRGVDQDAVEVGARDRVDHFVLALAVGHERQRAVDGVQHAARHRDEQRSHAIHHAGELQRANAARGKGEIDRAARRDRGAAHVRHSLEDAHRMAAAREQRREQRSGEACADDRYRLATLLGAALIAGPVQAPRRTPTLRRTCCRAARAPRESRPARASRR